MRILLALFIFSCISLGGQDYFFTFEARDKKWQGDFAEYPVGEEEFYELKWGFSLLPYPIPAKGSIPTLSHGLYLSGNNHSDDLFMFVKREINGLKPNTFYTLDFEVILETNTPAEATGIGGAPGESVYFKVGASSFEPRKINKNGFYELNVDKGYQSEGGSHALVIGNLANKKVSPLKPKFLPKILKTDEPLVAKTNSEGNLWIFLGTDSGYEGLTKFYIAYIALNAND